MRNGFIRRRVNDVVSEVDHVSEREHFVHFYEKDQELADGVARFLAVGFAQGNYGLVIATPEHIAQFDEGIREAGADPEALRKSGQYSTFDAADVLSRFVAAGKLQPGRFRSGIIGAWLKAAAKSGKGIRAFGEMVAILWEDGNKEGAIELEKLWNEVAQEHEFTLYCAYPAAAMDEFSDAACKRVCREHSRIIRPQAALA